MSARGLIPVCDTDGRLDESPGRSTTLAPIRSAVNKDVLSAVSPAALVPTPVPAASTASAAAAPPLVAVKRDADQSIGLSTVTEEEDAEVAAAKDNEKKVDDNLLDLIETSVSEPVRDSVDAADAGVVEEDECVSHEAEEAWGLDAWDLFSNNSKGDNSNANSSGTDTPEENEEWTASLQTTTTNRIEDVAAPPLASPSRDETKSTTTLPPLVEKNTSVKTSPIRLSSKSKGKLSRRTGMKATSKRQITAPPPPEVQSEDRNDDTSSSRRDGGDTGDDGSRPAPSSASYSKSIFSLLEGLDVTSA